MPTKRLRPWWPREKGKWHSVNSRQLSETTRRRRRAAIEPQITARVTMWWPQSKGSKETALNAAREGVKARTATPKSHVNSDLFTVAHCRWFSFSFYCFGQQKLILFFFPHKSKTPLFTPKYLSPHSSFSKEFHKSINTVEGKYTLRHCKCENIPTSSVIHHENSNNEASDAHSYKTSKSRAKTIQSHIFESCTIVQNK